jgi:ankyrin repeat protein
MAESESSRRVRIKAFRHAGHGPIVAQRVEPSGQRREDADVEAGDPTTGRFRSAVERGDAAEVRALVEGSAELRAAIDAPWFAFGKPAIVDAAARMDRALVDTLLDLGADLDARSSWDNGPYTALHSLVDGPTPARLEFAEYLVERGATVDLHAAAGLGRGERIREILDAEPERVSEPGPDGATPLHLARDPGTARLLLERGAEIDKRCVDHRSTPAMWATDGREDVMRFLLDQGAKPDLYQAVLLDDIDLAARILAEEPDAIHVSVGFRQSHPHLGGGDKYTWALRGAGTPVELARRRNRTGTYRFLLDRSPPDVRLLQAALRGDRKTMEQMLDDDRALLPSLTDHRRCEILSASPEGASALLSRGVDPNVRDASHGATALHHAAWRGEEGVARALLSAGADPGLRDREHDGTPLDWARHGGQADLVRLLSR